MKAVRTGGLVALLALVFVGACSQMPTEVKRQSDSTGDEIGAPCDPETYQGVHRCIPDSTSITGYIVAT